MPEPEEFKAPPDEGVEMSDLNVGEQGIVDGLNETLYELDEMEDKMGTEFYSIRTEEGLENTLKLLNDAKWDEGMEMVEVDTGLEARLAEQRLQPEPLEFRSVQLDSVFGESKLSVAQEMKGTGLKPWDVDMFSRTKAVKPVAIELVEMRVDLGSLPAPSESEVMPTMNPIETEFLGPTSQPVGFHSFMEENYPNYEESPELNEMLYGEEVEMGGLDWAAVGGELADWGSAAVMGTMDAIVGSAAGMAMGLVYLSPLIAIEELVPVVAKLVKGNWWIKDYDEQQRNYDYALAKLGSIMGTYWQLADQITYLYNETPQYVWFRDNGLAGNTPPLWFQDDDKVGNEELLGDHIWGYKGFSSPFSFHYTQLSGTGLWKRARILTVEGTGMGLMDDTKKGFWVYLKICDEDCDTELDPDSISIWFRCGVDGYLLPDDAYMQALCTLYNLKLIDAMLPAYEPKIPQGKKKTRRDGCCSCYGSRKTSVSWGSCGPFSTSTRNRNCKPRQTHTCSTWERTLWGTWRKRTLTGKDCRTLCTWFGPTSLFGPTGTQT